MRQSVHKQFRVVPEVKAVETFEVRRLFAVRQERRGHKNKSGVAEGAMRTRDRQKIKQGTDISKLSLDRARPLLLTAWGIINS